MPGMNIFDVFEILLDKLNNEIEAIKKSGETAIEKNEFDQARVKIDTVDKLIKIRTKFKDLMEELKSLVQSYRSGNENSHNGTHRKTGRIPRGQSTSQTEFFVPILHVLVENGGRGSSENILNEVYNKMKNIFKSADYEKINSGTDVRWHKNANWARYRMQHNEGLLRNDSPRGIWEISEKGREYLRNHIG